MSGTSFDSPYGDEQAQDAIAALLAAGGSVSVAYDDANNQLTISLADSISVSGADVTGETFIEASRAAADSGLTAGTWHNLFDTEETDNRGEFTNFQFSPDKDGWYVVDGVMGIDPGSSGDALAVRCHNVTDDTTVKDRLAQFYTPDVNAAAIPFSATVPLDSAKTYEIQGSDFQSSFALRRDETFGTIKRSVIQA
jgi:hypothetical protein